MEEMMERQGQSQSKGGKELEISLEQQKGSSPQDSDNQYAPENLPLSALRCLSLLGGTWSRTSISV